MGLDKWERSYGFDEIALVPSLQTIDILDVDISTNIGGVKLSLPILASAMDSVVDVSTASLMFGLRTNWLQPLNGTLDDVRIYSRALSAAEVLQLYRLGL